LSNLEQFIESNLKPDTIGGPHGTVSLMIDRMKSNSSSFNEDVSYYT